MWSVSWEEGIEEGYDSDTSNDDEPCGFYPLAAGSWEEEPIRCSDLSETDTIVKRFANLLLGEEMPRGAKGVCTALAISNTVTKLSAIVLRQYSGGGMYAVSSRRLASDLCIMLALKVELDEKELRREEEIDKRAQAEERKKKLAEKSAAKAATKAQKEDEKKLKVEVDEKKLKELRREEEIAKCAQAEEREKKLAENAAAKEAINAQTEDEKKLKVDESGGVASSTIFSPMLTFCLGKEERRYGRRPSVRKELKRRFRKEEKRRLPSFGKELHPRKKLKVGTHCELPKNKHGSRIVAGVCNKEIIVCADTRVTKDNENIKGELFIVNDETSKILSSCKGVLAAYVGDEDLWRDVCEIVKDKYVQNKTDMHRLACAIHNHLMRYELRRGNQGIDLVLAWHDEDSQPHMIRVVVNSPEDTGEEDDASPSPGVAEITFERSRRVNSHFIVMGGANGETEHRIKNRCKDALNVEEAVDMGKDEVGLSALEYECVGGNIEVAQLRPGKDVVIRTKCVLEHYLRNFNPVVEANVILTFRYQEDKRITSFLIAKHLVGRTGRDYVSSQYMGSMRLSSKVVFVDRVKFESPQIAQDVVNNIRVVEVKGGFDPTMKCTQIKTSRLYFSLATSELLDTLVEKYKFDTNELKKI